MKLALALVSATMAANDADFTHDASNNDVVRFSSTNNKCLKCEATGANTAATYAACNTGKSLEVCSDLHYDDFECFHRVTMNRSSEVIQLETGCKQGNACRTAERQNYVGGIALRNQCKPDPSVFGPRFNGRSVCNTCFPLCTADTVDCFDPNNQSGFVPGIYDGAAYHGAVGDHANWVASGPGTPAITNTAEFWQPGYFVNLWTTNMAGD